MDDRVGHLRRYRRAGLVELLAAAGFRITYAGYVDSLGFAAGTFFSVWASDFGRFLAATFELLPIDVLAGPPYRGSPAPVPWLGFRLAEHDLRLRGPGDFIGVRQSGMPEMKVADLNDTKLIELARQLAARLG